MLGEAVAGEVKPLLALEYINLGRSGDHGLPAEITHRVGLVGHERDIYS
jgi:hypothetical protein